MKARTRQRHNLLEVMIGVHEGGGHQSNWDQAVTSVVAQGLETPQEMPLRGVLLLATADWCQDNDTEPLPQLIRRKLKDRFDYDVPLIGGSMPGIFVSDPPREKSCRITQGFVLLCLFSHSLWVNVDKLLHPYRSCQKIRLQNLVELKARLLNSRRTRAGLGTSANIDLFTIFPGPIVKPEGERLLLDIELHNQLLMVFNESVRIFGASAGNDIWPTKGFQFVNNERLESSLAIALLEYDFEMNGAMTHGFKPIPELKVSVDKLSTKGDKGYVVEILDGKPASERLQEILVQTYPNLPNLPRPILALGSSEIARVIVPTQRPSEMVGAMRFNREIPVGYRLSVLKATPEELSTHEHKTLETILPPQDKRSMVKAIFSVACVSRFDYFDKHIQGSWWTGAENIAKTLRPIPYVCALSAGEFGTDVRRYPRGDHFSIWFSTLEGRPNERARNRILQEDLLDAAHALLSCREPKQVMERAIDSAIAAGALGGMICVCDPDIGMVLGGDNGHAKSAAGSGLHFEGTLKTTFNHLPAEGVYYHLPEEIGRWTIQAAPSPEKINTRINPERDTNIKAILCANRMAIYIPDSADPKFYCDPISVTTGNLRAQFISPLFGSHGKVVGTIQLGFSKTRPMDRESMGLWLGYAQKVATALERALEIEEKEILSVLDTSANVIMKRPAPTSSLPEEEIREYLDLVAKQIRADHVHVRVRHDLAQNCRYSLLTTSNLFGYQHKKMRPYLYRSTGSVGLASINNEAFTNDKKTTSQMFQSLTPPEPTTTMHEEKWEREVRSFSSCGILRLSDTWSDESPYHPILGSFVLCSQKEYFFTRRRKAIVSFAARQLEVLIQKREADYTRAYNDDLLAGRGLLTAAALHDVLRPLVHIQRDLDLLRMTVTALPKANDLIDKLERHKEEAFHILSDPVRSVENSIVRLTIGELMKRARERMKMQWDDVPEIPPEAGCIVVDSNFWLPIAIGNLLDNAVEGAREIKNGRVYVTVNADSRDSLTITIGNDGRELSDEDLADMKVVGKSKKVGPHLGIGVPLADFGIRSVGGKLESSRRSSGGLEMRVKLRTKNKGE